LVKSSVTDTFENNFQTVHYIRSGSWRRVLIPSVSASRPVPTVNCTQRGPYGVSLQSR